MKRLLTILAIMLVLIAGCNSTSTNDECQSNIQATFVDKQYVEGVYLYMFKDGSKTISIQSCKKYYIRGKQYGICYLGNKQWDC